MAAAPRLRRHVIHGEPPRDLVARTFAGGWYTCPSPPIDHLLDAYSCMVGWYLGDGAARVRVRPIVDPVRDREIAEGRILRKGLATQRTGGLLARIGLEIGRTNLHECVRFGESVLAVASTRCLQIDPETLAWRGDAFGDLVDGSDPTVVHHNHPQLDPRTGRLLT
jgi:hypothetical protein